MGLQGAERFWLVSCSVTLLLAYDGGVVKGITRFMLIC